MKLVKEILGFDNPKYEYPIKLPKELLKSLCFNCDNRSHCVWKEERKIYCQHFE